MIDRGLTLRAAASFRRSRPLRTGAAALAAALAATLLPGSLTPAAADPDGTVTLPPHDSAEEFGAIDVLASSRDGLVLSFRDAPSQPLKFRWIAADRSVRELPDDLPLGAYVDGYRLADSTFTTVNGAFAVRRYDLAAKSPASGDGTPLTSGYELGDVTTDGWLETAGSSGDREKFVVLRRPGRPDLTVAPTTDRHKVAYPVADGRDVYWAEPASSPTRIAMLDGATDAVRSVADGTSLIQKLWLTPAHVVWVDYRPTSDPNLSDYWWCKVDRTAPGTPACVASWNAANHRTAVVTDTSIFYQSWNGLDATFKRAPLAQPDATTPISRDGKPLVAREYFPMTIFGDGVALLPDPVDSIQYATQGESATQSLFDAPRRPATSGGLALSSGRLISADSREFFDGGVSWSTTDNGYPSWVRPVTRAASLSVGSESSYGPVVYRSTSGNGITLSGRRALVVTSSTTGQHGGCDFAMLDGSQHVWSYKASRCDGMALSGNFFAASDIYNPGVQELGGSRRLHLPCMTVANYALFGSRVAYVTADNVLMVRDLARPTGATNPRQIGTADCSSGSVSMWGKHLVHSNRFAYSTIYNLETGESRRGPDMLRHTVIDGAVVWQQTSGCPHKVLALDLTSAEASPVEIGDAACAPGQYAADDHLVAWQDAGSGSVKVAPLPFGQSTPHPPRLLGAVAPTVLAAKAPGGLAPWHVAFDVTKPLSSWRVDLRNVTGTVVKSFTGTAPLGGIRLDWDGRLGSRWAPGGKYTWTLTGTAADGEGTLRNLDGQAVPLTGTLTVKDAKARDLTSDGVADLLGRDGAGDVYRYNGKSPSGFVPRVKAAAGWGKHSIVTGAGDLTGDGRPDVVARDAAGDLWRYDGNGAGGFRTRVKVGAGWGKYTAVIGPGDLTGDGRADLLARDAAGTLWRYDGTGVGTLRARVQVGGGWDRFNAVAAVGDFTSDGRPDLVVRDAYGYLYRYDGTGTGTFKPRVRIGSSWQSYSQLTGLGDLDGDGQSDLLARDSAGTLWRYPGNGKGGFMPRVSLGTAFKSYNRLF